MGLSIFQSVQIPLKYFDNVRYDQGVSGTEVIIWIYIYSSTTRWRDLHDFSQNSGRDQDGQNNVNETSFLFIAVWFIVFHNVAYRTLSRGREDSAGCRHIHK